MELAKMPRWLQKTRNRIQQILRVRTSKRTKTAPLRTSLISNRILTYTSLIIASQIRKTKLLRLLIGQGMAKCNWMSRKTWMKFRRRLRKRRRRSALAKSKRRPNRMAQLSSKTMAIRKSEVAKRRTLLKRAARPWVIQDLQSRRRRRGLAPQRPNPERRASARPRSNSSKRRSKERKKVSRMAARTPEATIRSKTRTISSPSTWIV